MSSYVRSFNRYELKYCLPRESVHHVVAAMRKYVYADRHDGDSFGYPIASIYYDSPSHVLFWEKVEGIKFRRKLRFRRYGDSADVYLEIKQRIDRTVQKRRVRWPLQRAVRAMRSSHQLDCELRADSQAVTSEASFLFAQYGLVPAMAISYRRNAYFASYETDQRITFDTNVRYDSSNLDIEGFRNGGKYLVDPGVAIMEIKFNNTVPMWLCKIIAAFDLKMIRLSKYCTAVDREHFQGRLT